MKDRTMMHFACRIAVVAALVSSTWANAQFPGMSQPKHYAWSDVSLSPDTRADMVVKELTLDEKIQMVHGLGWQALFVAPESGPGTRAISAGAFIPGIPRLG